VFLQIRILHYAFIAGRKVRRDFARSALKAKPAASRFIKPALYTNPCFKVDPIARSGPSLLARSRILLWRIAPNHADGPRGRQTARHVFETRRKFSGPRKETLSPTTRDNVAEQSGQRLYLRATEARCVANLFRESLSPSLSLGALWSSLGNLGDASRKYRGRRFRTRGRMQSDLFLAASLFQDNTTPQIRLKLSVSPLSLSQPN